MVTTAVFMRDSQGDATDIEAAFSFQSGPLSCVCFCQQSLLVKNEAFWVNVKLGQLLWLQSNQLYCGFGCALCQSDRFGSEAPQASSALVR